MNRFKNFLINFFQCFFIVLIFSFLFGLVQRFITVEMGITALIFSLLAAALTPWLERKSNKNKDITPQQSKNTNCEITIYRGIIFVLITCIAFLLYVYFSQERVLWKHYQSEQSTQDDRENWYGFEALEATHMSLQNYSDCLKKLKANKTNLHCELDARELDRNLIAVSNDYQLDSETLYKIYQILRRKNSEVIDPYSRDLVEEIYTNLRKDKVKTQKFYY